MHLKERLTTITARELYKIMMGEDPQYQAPNEHADVPASEEYILDNIKSLYALNDLNGKLSFTMNWYFLNLL